MLDSAWRDTRHAVRALRAAPSLTVVALVVLTLSIGDSTLGAVSSAILRSVLGRACLYVTVGLAIGVAGALDLARLVAGFLFPAHPMISESTRVCASFSSRLDSQPHSFLAARVDPLVALRME